MANEPASTAAWMRIAPQRVRLDHLHPSHAVRDDYVAEKHRKWWTSHSGDIYVHAIRRQDGQLVIADGHHRVARARELGQRWIWVRLHEPEA